MILGGAGLQVEVPIILENFALPDSFDRIETSDMIDALTSSLSLLSIMY